MNYTADEIRSYQFQKSGISGYKASDVDEFLDNIASDYDEMSKAKAEFVEKIKVLADKINEYRENEDSVKEAILSAQKTGDEILRERKELADNYYNEKVGTADAKAKEINETTEKLISEAKTKAQEIIDRSTMESQRILTQAKSQAEKVHSEMEQKMANEIAAYEELKSAIDQFKDELFDSYKKHMTMISSIKTKSPTAELYQAETSPADTDEEAVTETETEGKSEAEAETEE